MKCVILQPFCIPWRGYFHQIQKADAFIFYDDVQYEKRGWCSRNRIKTANGRQWLSIPVLNKGSIIQGIPINEIEIDGTQNDWREKHRKTLRLSYEKAPFFSKYELLLTDFYKRDDRFLADLTIDLTIALARELGIEKTKFYRASEFGASGRKTDRLLFLLDKIGATHYITGAAAESYIETEKFDRAGINFEYMTYDYPEYKQFYPPFDGAVSILDLLFMTGGKAGKYIWNTEE
ncbi:MAG: WbqC family protein [Pyrinomonadaceae bacterium]|nr:WbqC family protein [Pyrinomonadaceae bacterium]